MRLLIDTHTLIWFILDSHQLSPIAKVMIEDENNDILVSTASLWEIAIKMSLGKLDMGAPFAELVPGQLIANRIEILPISVTHLHQVAQLPFHHRDPFDRLLIAQSQVEQIPRYLAVMQPLISTASSVFGPKTLPQNSPTTYDLHAYL